MFGLCFLVRSDAAFLILAVLLARLVLLWPRSAKLWWDRIVEAAVPELISVIIALPWLIYNYHLFGSILPISAIEEHLFGSILPDLSVCRLARISSTSQLSSMIL